MPKQTSYREELIEDWKEYIKPGNRIVGIGPFIDWLEQQEESKPWTPRKDEQYFYVTTLGNVATYAWNDDYHDHSIQSFQGCSRTKEEAEAKAEKIRNLLKTV